MEGYTVAESQLSSTGYILTANKVSQAEGAVQEKENASEIAFSEAVEAQSEEDIRAFLAGTPEDARPVAIFVNDSQVTLADGSGRFLSAQLSGDLLTPGLELQEVLRPVTEDMAGHPYVVHDGKRLLHTLRRLDLQLPDAFGWDVMLGAYLLNPQEKSYAFGEVRRDLADDAAGLLSLSVW